MIASLFRFENIHQQGKVFTFLFSRVCFTQCYSCGTRGGQMVSVSDPGSGGSSSSPGWTHCVVFFGKTLYSQSASLLFGGSNLPSMDQHPIQGRVVRTYERDSCKASFHSNIISSKNSRRFWRHKANPTHNITIRLHVYGLDYQGQRTQYKFTERLFKKKLSLWTESKLTLYDYS